MNKNAIQKYAIWARNELIEQVKQRAFQYGIDEKGYGDENASVIAGRVLSEDEKRQRRLFVNEIKRSGYNQAVEEVAYTWFNRFIALRYMEVNDFLPTHIRVFSDASGNFNPEILTNILHLELPGLDKAKVSEYLNGNQAEELYRYLLLTQCNALNNSLPEMFEKLGGYTEMLLPNNILKSESVIGRLVKDIPEEDFRDAVQIIGWMYQYYNSQPKQDVFDSLKKKVKITKDKIPAATQLFTPDWIVRYMVENSLGRLWLESHPNNELKIKWRYYLEEAEQTPEVAERLLVLRSQSLVKSPEDIRLIDPCMGSGHILVYAFDVLMQIYVSEGYNPRNASKLILEKNIYGLDIDRRAYQLAYFSLMMKARQYNRRVFTEGVKPQVYYPTGWIEGEEYGSLAKVEVLPSKPEQLKDQLTIFDNYEWDLRVWNFKRLLAQKYDVVVTNPPYAGGRNINSTLLEYLKREFPDSKSDMFSAFIERCGELTKANGYQAMITMHSWMFLSSFEKLRNKLLHKDIVSIAHLGARAFEEISGEVVQTASFVLRNSNFSNYLSTFVRLVDQLSQKLKEDAFLKGQSRYYSRKELFSEIPGNPFAYWLTNNSVQIFVKGKQLEIVANPRQGMKTLNNDYYIHFWYEVDFSKSLYTATSLEEAQSSGKVWFPINHGGESRKYYGNNSEVVNWYNDGFEMKAQAVKTYGTVTRTITNIAYYFKEGITWSVITSTPSFRRYYEGHLFSNSGQSIVPETPEMLDYLTGLLNSKISTFVLQILSPTLGFESGYLKKIPIIVDSTRKATVEAITIANIDISRTDWDSFEISWDFKRHPLICNERTVAAAFAKWGCEATERFDTMKANEQELNRIFIDIYGLHDELTPEVEDKDVTVRQADLEREVRSLISYAVGCMLGRYSLGSEGLAYAGGTWDFGKYKAYPVDKDNILPIYDDEYFDDDITGRFIDFVKTVYGADTLEENLKFIADALGGKGTPREVIRNYFLNDFYKDHVKIYQKRPIYWLFDSGKKNGFKALIYMHRYSRDLLAKLRTDYVHEQQERYRTQLSHITSALTTASGAERAKLLKQQDKLTEQLREITDFEEKVHHLADQNIMIDLDDGVKKNYEIFADVLAKI